MIHWARDDRAVSDVVGTMLMVALITMFSITIGIGLLSIHDSEPSAAHAGVTFEENIDDSVDVVWTDRATAEKIIVSNTTVTREITEFGDRITMGYGQNGENIDVYAQRRGATTFIATYDVPEFTTSVYMESSTCDKPPGYCGSTVVFNGSTLFSQRGVNVLVLDEQGAFYSYAWYDTHSNDRWRPPTYTLAGDGTPAMNAQQDCTNCVESEIHADFNAIPEGYYIAIIGDDQPGRVSDALENRYRDLGAEFSGYRTFGYRDSWILVSKNGDGPLFERHEPKGDLSGVGSVEAFFYAPHDDD